MQCIFNPEPSFFSIIYLHLLGMLDIMHLQRMREESSFLLATVLSSVHIALPLKCIQEQRWFFFMRFRFFYGLDTKGVRGQKYTLKKGCC